MSKRAKIYLSLFSVLLISTLILPYLSAFAQNIQYPSFGGRIKPPPSPTAKEGLPKYVRYLFSFFIVIAGIIALGALIYGGFEYLTSVGNPANREEAKNRIIAAFIGLVILLSSYIILSTINPSLTNLKGEPPEPNSGIYLIAIEKGKEKKYYIADSQDGILKKKPDGKTPITFSQVEFISDKPADDHKADIRKNDLKAIYVTPGPKFDPEHSIKIDNPGKKGRQGFGFTSPVSIHFLWQLPGVYLYTDREQSPPFFTQTSIADLAGVPYGSSSLDNRIKKIRLVDDIVNNSSYYSFVFDNANFNRKASGHCKFIQAGTVSDFGKVHGISSIAVVEAREKAANPGEITFYKSQGCKGEGTGEAYKQVLSPSTVIGGIGLTKTKLDHWGSIEKSGNYSLLLFTKENRTGYCTLFLDNGCINNGTFNNTGVYSTGHHYEPKSARWFPMIK